MFESKALLPSLDNSQQYDFVNDYRWLRILGIDAKLETSEEEIERTSGGEM